MTARSATAAVRPIARSQGQLALAIQELIRNRLAVAGLAVLGALAAVAVLAPWIVPVDPTAQQIDRSFAPPSWQEPLGTDSFGRDVLSRLIYGARISLSVAVIPVLAALAVGVPVGLLSGYIGGVLDTVAMRITDAFLSFPAILLAIAIMGVLGPSVQNVVLALWLVYAPVFARLARGSALALRGEEYVIAARAVGIGESRIALRHVLPNSLGPLIVQATVSFSTAIVAEATLSFLGLGSQPPTPSWGLMLNEGRRYLDSAPWLAVSVSALITLSVLAINFLGDGLRDALDPQYRSQ